MKLVDLKLNKVRIIGEFSALTCDDITKTMERRLLVWWGTRCLAT